MVGKSNGHWTNRGIGEFQFRIAADFCSQINATDAKASPDDLNLINLYDMIRAARARGKKVAVVLYDDGDKDNMNGPIHSDMFRICWELAGKPVDFFAIEPSNPPRRRARR